MKNIKLNKQLFSFLFIVVIALGLLAAKAIPSGKVGNLVGTIVQKTAVPGGNGNVLTIICDVDGNLVRVPYDWDASTVIGERVKLLRLDRVFWGPIYRIDVATNTGI